MSSKKELTNSLSRSKDPKKSLEQVKPYLNPS